MEGQSAHQSSPGAQSSTALVHSLTTVNASGGALAASPPPPYTSSHHHNVQEAEEAWPLVTKGLMLAIMGSQSPHTAATTLLAVFRPMVDGWATARKEAKRWKERAEAYLAEHHRHKTEIAHKHDSLQAEVQALEQRLAESQNKLREFESQRCTHLSNVSSLEKKVAEAEAAARAAKEAHAQEALERKREAEAMAKSAQDANENLRRDSDNKMRTQNAEINKLLEKVKEIEAVKSTLEERLGSSIAKNTALESEQVQRSQENSNLQTRITELTTRKDALERQLALYQRIPTRRF